MPFSGTESTEDGSDWPPQGGDISEPFCYDFTPGELAEVHEYFKTRLNLTLPRKISRSMGLKEEIHNGFYRAMEDRYYLGIMFFFHYLGQYVNGMNGLNHAAYTFNNEAMRFIASRYSEQIRENRWWFLVHRRWSEKETSDEKIIEQIKFFSDEILPLVRLPCDSPTTNLHSDSEREDLFFDKFAPWSRERAHDFTTGELRKLVFNSVLHKRRTLTRWLLDTYSPPTDAKCFVKPGRVLPSREAREMFGQLMNEMESDWPVKVSLASNLEPRQLYRELLAHCDRKSIKELHFCLTHRDCPAMVRDEMFGLIRGQDELTESIQRVFSRYELGRELLRLAHE